MSKNEMTRAERMDRVEATARQIQDDLDSMPDVMVLAVMIEALAKELREACPEE